LRDQAELGPTQTAPAEPRQGALAGRRFLLVTLPAGPFGRFLDQALRQAGAETLRVVLNGGDLMDWRSLKRTVRCYRPFEEWPAFIAETIAERKITDVVVFGDVTAYCAGAVCSARSAGTRIWVMENGYRRSNWVTLEADGVNANSRLPRTARAYDDVDMRPLGEGPSPVGAITPYHALNVFDYFAGVILAWPVFRRYRYPYAMRIWPQAFGHARRYIAWLFRRQAREREALALLDDPRPFFLACLQREGDSQLLCHSKVKTNRAFMTEVIRSFASHAPADAFLVIKNHPLDPGVEDLARACETIAWSHGLGGRVRFVEGGPFSSLARAARGIVAVNSTAALAALDFGAPVKLLGRALFDIDGLTDPQPLETFWRDPVAPDDELLARFRRRLSLRTQVWGSYHNPKVMARTALGIVARIIAPDAEFLA
jgi:capsular polysaccharide export protein